MESENVPYWSVTKERWRLCPHNPLLVWDARGVCVADLSGGMYGFPARNAAWIAEIPRALDILALVEDMTTPIPDSESSYVPNWVLREVRSLLREPGGGRCVGGWTGSRTIDNTY